MTANGDLDFYEVLGVARDASRDEIALAWRRRARAEHPDARTGDTDAPARFRTVAEAWHVLGDPGRRAAYDQGCYPGRRPGSVRVTVRRAPAGAAPALAASAAPPAGASRPPLVAGPTRVNGSVGSVAGQDEEGLR